MTEIGRWRRIYSCEWHAPAFQALSDAERTVYFYAKTGPQSTSVGIYRISAALAVEDIGNLTAADFRQRLDVVSQAFDWRYDLSTRVLWIPEWLVENPPQSPNVCVSWRKLIANLPDCELKAEAVTAIVRYLKDLPKAFVEAFGKDLSKDIQISKAKTQAIHGTEEHGIQRSERKRAGAALRAVALNEVNPEWLSIARLTVGKYGKHGLDLETLVDYFHHEGKPRTQNAKKKDVIEALNIALSERRQAVS